jgi:TonB family protein
MNIPSRSIFQTLLLVVVLLWTSSLLSGDGPADQGEGETINRAAYHLRLMRVQWDAGLDGSALFRPEALVVPSPDQETWGRPAQIESLREALGARDIEPVPGMVVGEGATEQGKSHFFRTALGDTLVGFSVLGERLPDGWHRVQIVAKDEWGEELVDASLLVQAGGTVALMAPLIDQAESLILGVTPMRSGGRPEDGVRRAGEERVTYPELIKSTKVMPRYPEEARKQLISGAVILEAVIRSDGVPERIVVLKMPEGGERLAGVAVDAVSQWRYEPATLNGEPVDVYLTIVVQFALK